jgi:hypothetical protein
MHLIQKTHLGKLLKTTSLPFVVMTLISNVRKFEETAPMTREKVIELISECKIWIAGFGRARRERSKGKRRSSLAFWEHLIDIWFAELLCTH